MAQKKVWVIEPSKGTITETKIEEHEIAAQGTQEWIFIRPALFGVRKKVITVLLTEQPELFSVPLEQAFVQALARALMKPAKPAGGVGTILVALILGGLLGWFLHGMGR